MLDSKNWDDLPIYSAFALNAVNEKNEGLMREKHGNSGDGIVVDDEIGNFDIENISNELESDYVLDEISSAILDLEPLDLNEQIVHVEEGDYSGADEEDENAYLLEIMNDTDQWLKDNM